MSRFDYVQFDEKSKRLQEALKTMFDDIDKFVEHEFQESREKSLLMTGLEQAYMWTGKMIRNDQLKRT